MPTIVGGIYDLNWLTNSTQTQSFVGEVIGQFEGLSNYVFAVSWNGCYLPDRCTGFDSRVLTDYSLTDSFK